jgi:predicted RNA-binding Zn-ribbon protein involved in translation (DUF1610 family)
VSALPETSFFKKQCPACGHSPIEGRAFAFGSKVPTFFCPRCNEQLTTVAKPRMVLGIVFAAVAFPAVRQFNEWVQSQLPASPVAKGINVVVISVACAVATWLIFRGLVVRRWEQRTRQE